MIHIKNSHISTKLIEVYYSYTLYYSERYDNEIAKCFELGKKFIENLKDFSQNVFVEASILRLHL